MRIGRVLDSARYSSYDSWYAAFRTQSQQSRVTVGYFQKELKMYQKKKEEKEKKPVLTHKKAKLIRIGPI